MDFYLFCSAFKQINITVGIVSLAMAVDIVALLITILDLQKKNELIESKAIKYISDMYEAGN